MKPILIVTDSYNIKSLKFLYNFGSFLTIVPPYNFEKNQQIDSFEMKILKLFYVISLCVAFYMTSLQEDILHVGGKGTLEILSLITLYLWKIMPLFYIFFASIHTKLWNNYLQILSNMDQNWNFLNCKRKIIWIESIPIYGGLTYGMYNIVLRDLNIINNKIFAILLINGSLITVFSFTVLTHLNSNFAQILGEKFEFINSGLIYPVNNLKFTFNSYFQLLKTVKLHNKLFGWHYLLVTLYVILEFLNLMQMRTVARYQNDYHNLGIEWYLDGFMMAVSECKHH